MTQTAVPVEPHTARFDVKRRGRHQQIRTQIVEYLARNGASKLSEITNEVPACRDTIRSHLTALENAAVVRSNIPPGTRARTTPFYSLAAQASLRGVTARKEAAVKLTVHIKQATDGQLTLGIDEIPGLIAYAPSFHDIPEAVQAAAAKWTGQPPEEFTVLVRI